VSELRKGLVALGVAALVLTMATPSWAVSNYTIVERVANAFPVFTTHPLFNQTAGHDDEVVKLATNLSGNFKLPFAVHFYGQNFSTIWVSTNGNVQFGTALSGNTAFTNDCLPSANIHNKMAAVFWDDLISDANTSEGVFWKRFGAGGSNDRFTIYWNERKFGGSQIVQAELTFFKNQNTLAMVYNTSAGESATIGVQNGAQPFKQFACNSGIASQVQPLLRIDFVR
jgi:hypothetical protein